MVLLGLLGSIRVAGDAARADGDATRVTRVIRVLLVGLLGFTG